MAPKNEQLEYIQNPGFEGGVFKLGRIFFLKELSNYQFFCQFHLFFPLLNSYPR